MSFAVVAVAAVAVVWVQDSWRGECSLDLKMCSSEVLAPTVVVAAAAVVAAVVGCDG